MAVDYVDIERTFAEASEALSFDLWQLVQNGPEDSLNKTTNTQPAMLAAGVAVWRAWQSRGGPLPDYMAGHSLGEYTALVCARAIEFKEAVQLVADRGRFMQEAVPIGEGAMAAIIGLDDDAVRQLCEQVAAGDVVAPVNFNAPGQVVDQSPFEHANCGSPVFADCEYLFRANALPYVRPPGASKHCETVRLPITTPRDVRPLISLDQQRVLPPLWRRQPLLVRGH